MTPQHMGSRRCAQTRRSRVILAIFAFIAILTIVILQLWWSPYERKATWVQNPEFLFPFYVYPAPGTWTPLENVVSTHPKVNFTVVINSGSGPGPNPLPDGNYTREIPKLASYDNVRLLGYVATTYATRDISLVRKDIETYAGWSTNSSIPYLAVRGIFFDETPQQYDANVLTYLEELRDVVRGAPGLGPDNYIFHNPGVIPDSRYLPMADSTIVFEATYDTFQEHCNAKIFKNIPDSNRSQLCAVIHSVPDSVRGPQLRSLVKQARKVAEEVFITHLATDMFHQLSGFRRNCPLWRLLILPWSSASHHSAGASYGVVCKMKRNCTLQIWDHAISWRETNLCLSSALSTLSPFIWNILLGLVRITSALTLHHADIITPCADFFNPEWEVEIGTCQGAIEHRNVFRRKVDPVVNGIIDMHKFSPVKEIKSQRPTVTMLSHVWYAKDIKTALLAADIIIKKWKFDDYYLEIYGAIDRAPMYSMECQEIIASKGLRGKATLRGTADPMDVLENTWLFLNSSLSEGLPLALGEAALTGAPVVCTDVGASLRVLSDPDDSSRFSAVVAPNDAVALARAQISMLAMIGEWSQCAEDTEEPPVLSSSPTPKEAEKITRRMYKSNQRRSLGMMTRKIVQRSFSGDRCLREHEQMLWIGESMNLMATRPIGDDHETKDVATGFIQYLIILENILHVIVVWLCIFTPDNKPSVTPAVF